MEKELYDYYINLCLSNAIALEDIRNALIIAHKIEIILLVRKQDFLAPISTDKHVGDYFYRKLTEDPPKYILKKIINSKAANFGMIKIAFEEFESIFSRERLVKSLAEIMVEVASIDTLLDTREMHTEKKMEILNKMILCEVMTLTDDDIVDLLKDIDKQSMDFFVKCLLSKEVLTTKCNKYSNGFTKLISGFVNVLSIRDCSGNNFSQRFVDIESKDFVHLCLMYDQLRMVIFEMLKDYLLTKHLSAKVLMDNFDSILLSRFTEYMASLGFDISSEDFVCKFKDLNIKLNN